LKICYERVAPNPFFIAQVHSGLVMDVANSNCGNGGDTIIHEHGGLNQQWCTFAGDSRQSFRMSAVKTEELEEVCNLL
jgi:hypothetical protein